MLFFCTNIDWTAVGSIATAISALLTLIMLGVNAWQISVLKKQRIEDNRARLNFSIIVWESFFILKIQNIGKEPAYDVELNFGGPLLDNHYSQNVIETFKNYAQRKIIMEAGKEIYILVSNGFSKGSRLTYPSVVGKCEESFTSDVINDWLNHHIDDKISISGTYCKKYKIQESFSITDFVTDSLVYYDDITSELKKINTYLKKISKNHG